MPEVPPECHLVARAVAGDRAAFGELAIKHRALVFGCAWSFTRHQQAAEDLTQEVFLHVFCNMWRVDPSRPFAPWLRVVARRVIINQLRGRAGDSTTVSMEEIDAPDPAADPCAALQRLATSEAVGTAITRAKLSEQDQAVLRMSTEGFSLVEIAGKLGMNINSCKSLHRRALRRLRPWIEASHEGSAPVGAES